MDCLTFEGDLVPFHFGTLGAAEQKALEAHLATCATCLLAYFDVKRAVERTETPRPSSALAARLRASIALEIAPQRSRMGVYGALAASFAAAALFGLVTRGPAPASPSVPTQLEARQDVPARFAGTIDTARNVDAPIDFY